jgi:YggT family protein
VSIVFQILLVLVNVYEIILLLRVLLSWFRIDPYNNPFARLLYRITEPVLEPIRSVLPPAGMIDFSPLVAFLLLMALQRIFMALM